MFPWDALFFPHRLEKAIINQEKDEKGMAWKHITL